MSLLINIGIVFRRIGIIKLLFFLVTLFCCFYDVFIYLLIIVTFLMLPVLLKKKYFDIELLLLLVFSIFYCLQLIMQDQIESGFNLISYMLCPSVFYCFGKDIVNRLKDASLIEIFILLCVIAISSVLFYFVILDISTNGFINALRDLPMGNKSNVTTAATLYGLVASYGLIGFSAFIGLSLNIKSIYRWLFLICCLLSLITTFHLVNRSGIIVFFLCVLFSSLYKSRFNIFKYVVYILFISVIFMILISFELIPKDVIDAYVYRSESENSQLIDAGGRSKRWINAFSNLFTYPFGWAFNSNVYNKYVHNFWLDIARVAGIFPFIVFLIVTIKSEIVLIKLSFVKNSSLVLLLIVLNICLLSSTFVEPVLEGFPLDCYLFCLFWGLQKQVYVNSNRGKIVLQNSFSF